MNTDSSNGNANADQAMPSRLRPTRHRRVPTILQMEAAECGAASLGMILAYYGLWIPLETLREVCHVSKDGTSAASILRGARRLGLKASGWRVEPEALAQHRLPAIAFWELNHFVVVEGVKKNSVIINDPAFGRRSIDAESFDAAFTGVLLTFEPTEAFKAGGMRVSLLRALLPRGRRTRTALGFLAIIAVCNLLPPIFLPAAGKIFADNVLVQHATSWLRPLLLALLVSALMSSVLSWLHGMVLTKLQRQMGTESAIQLMGHLLRLPINFFVQRHTGDITCRVDAAQHLSHSAVVTISSAVFSIMGAITSALIMMLYDVPMALGCFLLSAVDLVALYLVTVMRVDGVRRATLQRARYTTVALGGIQSIETIKASGSESDFFAKIAGAQAQLLNMMLSLERLTVYMTLVPQVIKSLSYAGLLGWGAAKVMGGDMTIGTLIAFLSVLQAFHTPVQTLVGAIGGLQELRGDLDRVQDTMRHAPAIVEKIEGNSSWLSEHGRLSGRITLHGISFSYSADRPLISDFNLDMPSGSWVALVGASGSGKSTISRILAGLLSPSDGRIMFDGVDAADIPRRVIAGSVSFVEQNVVLFEGTVRENIALWDPSLNDEAIVGAAKDACIHDDIGRRKGQYEAVIAEDGANFSGGQRQRFELARALATNPAILILDEATSALDTATELSVLDNLRRRGITILMVSHRLSTIRDCDEIIVLDHGQVVQRGKHEALMAVDGPYAELIRVE
ncbi:NHLP family bacteriocin export ABC transporter peptidase/permease/ATPase subunit [Granulibacter bethesdensis]|uniref:NHLP family bacteriocin export ABC transporter peptidase/permease/ATPase subunit n=1 Tax=Granulibacter bethesdensis TaxID=364410 RepID=UPI0003F21047|nr:NHLP family bacteriocin export ABC transporter peptidase/permease/ATPase subunit [Granulibacter bethesdensis]AHJ66012.1 Type I protein secretion transmembrane subunit [Granulibacter bethesdensis CGDNIH4]